MQGGAPNQANTLTGAVFLSYASQDGDAAARICNALRAAGLEVWFDQSELRGGDAWDLRIHREIDDCALFIPVISPNTASRREGYFRLEWDLADQRSHRMARDRAFIVPICLDATQGAGPDVPESFHRVHWTRLPGGETPPEFVAGIKRLLSADSPTTARLPAGAAPGASPFPARTGRSAPLRRALPVAIPVLVLAALAYLLINRPWISKPAAPVPTSNATSSPGAAPTAFNPPPHSIAVLPFVNISGDKEQEYFSDGLTEELLNSLSRINELQVAARTSSFSFQGEHPDIATVAHKLNVASVLDGSVRRSGQTIRVTAQLNNAVTGFHVWSQTYDRDLGDVLKLQTEIATAVATALRVTLLGDVTEKIAMGGTRKPAAFDAYLRGSKAFSSAHDASSLQSAINAYAEAIRLDPNYALAFASRSRSLTGYALEFGTGTAIHQIFSNAQADGLQAIKLAPQLAEGHLALASYFSRGSLDFTHASEAYERAAALAPGNAEVLSDSGRFAVCMGRVDTGLAAAHRAVELDPLNPRSRDQLGEALYFARRNKEAVAVFNETISLDPDYGRAYGLRGVADYGLGDFQGARSSCESKRNTWASQFCLAVTYDKLGQRSNAEAMLKRLQATFGDAGAYEYAVIYAQWSNPARALEWLATAVRLRDPDLLYVKIDPLMDPLRKEPRFQTIERELKFPD